MNILSLDCGISTGWASLSEGRVESGVQNFSLRRGESHGMIFLRFNKWLENMVALVCPQLVVYELAHLRGGAATNILVGMTTRIEESCAERGIEYASVHSATLKKASVKSGRASKEDMIRRAEEIFMKKICSDDEADALLLLHYAEREYGQG